MNTEKKYEKTIVVPIKADMHKKLRKISFDHEISISQLAREAFEKIIEKYKKSVDF